MTAAILYHLHNLKNVRKTHTRALLLVKMPPEKCDFTKNNSRPWIFFCILICINGTKLHQASYIYQIIFQELIIKCW